MKMFWSVISRLVVILIIAAAIVGGRAAFFYQGTYQPASVAMPGYRDVTVPPAPTANFTDNFSEGKTIVLVDQAHRNRFEREELSPLFLRLLSRDLTIRFLSP